MTRIEGAKRLGVPFRLWQILGLAMPISVQAAPPPPAEPSAHIDWAIANETADRLIKQNLFDPGSVVVEWTSGFQWGFIKNVMQAKQFGWVACGKYNAKNRMGGYVGFENFVVLVDEKGIVYFQKDEGDGSDFLNAVSYKSSCIDGSPRPPVNGELKNIDPAIPAASSSVADELAKLASLRDKGVISTAEFEAQKAKLLAR